MSDRLQRWDERNQRWAERMIATPPPEPDYRWLGVTFVAFSLLTYLPYGIGFFIAAVVLAVLLVRRRRQAS